MTGAGYVVAAEIAACVVGVAAVAMQGNLPGNFGDDDLKIQQIAQGTLVVSDKAFEAVASVYSAVGLADHAFLAGLFSFGLFFLVQLAIIRPRELARAHGFVLALVVGSVVIGGVFLGQYTKEIVTLSVVLVIGLSRRRSINVEMAILAAMLTISIGVRRYWLLVLVVYLAFRYLHRRRVALRWHLVLPMAVWSVLAVVFLVRLGGPLDMYRARANSREHRLGTNTIIDPLFGGDGPFVGFLNTVGAAVELVLPWSLLTVGAVYAVVGALIALLWMQFFSCYRRFVRMGTPDVVQERIYSLVPALLTIQALFEPDYGSYVRHLTPLLPLMALAMLRVALIGEERDDR
ncbi:hypothetical protein E8D34_05525 [Nocardioides sp. GY 10113]|uniref:hypothetical protein n=1 Tax=Nocardioides sp. GY 10113 TaxID=2569761 RepID=UPI0010A7DDB0|nr:hypothetical protein [Nocardioides sp. GY 10113]TIC88385.1 hypothetical protein E8D34_05525 [Nocardioides sp. GY 10113]